MPKRKKYFLGKIRQKKPHRNAKEEKKQDKINLTEMHKRKKIEKYDKI